MNDCWPAMTTTTDDKTIVRNYFNDQGFDRWSRIYGDGEVNKVQQDIRDGHQQTVDHVLNWFKQDGSAEGLTVCDAGCGVGSLSIPLAAMGAKIFASDISEKMVGEAKVRAQAELPEQAVPTFEAKDLETLSGSYHTVVCLDVLIHYPQEKAGDMISHLSSLAEKRLILSFAPKTFFYTFLKCVGSYFPGPSKATRAYLHSQKDIENALKVNGWELKRHEFTAKKFYFSRLVEAVKVADSAT